MFRHMVRPVCRGARESGRGMDRARAFRRESGHKRHDHPRGWLAAIKKTLSVKFSYFVICRPFPPRSRFVFFSSTPSGLYTRCHRLRSSIGVGNEIIYLSDLKKRLDVRINFGRSAFLAADLTSVPFASFWPRLGLSLLIRSLHNDASRRCLTRRPNEITGGRTRD